MIAILAAGVLSPFFLEVTPEVRSTYQSLGKIVEDRPMQVTFTRVGVDAGDHAGAEDTKSDLIHEVPPRLTGAE